MKRSLWLLAACWLCSARADEVWRILRPVDRAALQSGDLNIIATAPRGRLELDGKPIAAEETFKNVLHARAKAAPGSHTLSLAWDGGRHEIRFFVGSQAAPEFKLYRGHPLAAEVACTRCHGLSKRGRFRFKGGCFDCHATDTFPRVHNHNPDVLAECGECHDAHGSTERSLLVMDRAKACKLCHN